jgi:hypothetical protein
MVTRRDDGVADSPTCQAMRSSSLSLHECAEVLEDFAEMAYDARELP